MNYLVMLVVFGLLSHLGALADTHRLDDSASQIVAAERNMRWVTPLPGRSSNNDVVTRVIVNVRIDTSAWMGRTGQIFMALPSDGEPPVSAHWVTQGRLLPGRLVSGERGMVFSGTITKPLLEDQFVVDLKTDGRWMSPRRRMNFHFELDVD